MSNDKRLMEIRKKINKKRPSFRRVESWRYKRVSDSWRKSRGIDSNTRRKNKSGVKSPTVGYRNPKKVRNLHPSGYEEVRVSSIQDLNNINKNYQAVKISSRLGSKKRVALIDYCQKKGFKILNLGISIKEFERLESIAETPLSDMEDEEFLDVDELEDALEGE